MSKLYFNNVPCVGLLVLEKILFSFENIPIVFVCVDADKKRYLCVCDDVIDEESWIIVKISDYKLLRVLNDDETILSAFENNHVIVADKAFGEDIRYNEIAYCEIDADELPLCDQYLEMKEYLSEYIDKVRESSLFEGLWFDRLVEYSVKFKYDFENNSSSYPILSTKDYNNLVDIVSEDCSVIQLEYKSEEYFEIKETGINNKNVPYAA